MRRSTAVVLLGVLLSGIIALRLLPDATDEPAEVLPAPARVVDSPPPPDVWELDPTVRDPFVPLVSSSAPTEAGEAGNVSEATETIP